MADDVSISAKSDPPLLRFIPPPLLPERGTRAGGTGDWLPVRPTVARRDAPPRAGAPRACRGATISTEARGKFSEQRERLRMISYGRARQ
jgi:hypothetical protein